jgi:hypothetical protein
LHVARRRALAGLSRGTATVSLSRCHSYTPETLSDEQAHNLEGALWSALRALREHAELNHRMARRARENNLLTWAEGYENRARDAENKGQLIEEVLLSPKGLFEQQR